MSAQYLALLLSLLPRGALWTALRRGPVFRGVLQAVADGMARFHARVDDLVAEGDPRQASELLPEWEATAGLPDGCLVDAGGGSVQQRRNAVVGRLTATGGVSRAYFTRVAAGVGYAITIDDVSPAVWRVHAPDETVIEMTCDDTCNDALRTWGNEQLECTLNRIKPAHTQLLFAYGA